MRFPSAQALAIGQALVEPEVLTPRMAVDLQVLIDDWPQAQSKAFRAHEQSRLEGQWFGTVSEQVHRIKQRLTDFNAAPTALRYSIPDWLMQATVQDHPDLEPAFWSALMDRAPVDLRVNVGFCKRSQALQVFARKPGGGHRNTVFTLGLALGKAHRPHAFASFKKGHIEIQDEGSQLISALVGAKRGQMLWIFVLEPVAKRWP